MAAAEVAEPNQDRTTKRRPFTSWVKKLANRRNNDDSTSKRVGGSLLSSRNKKGVKNNPYPASGFLPRTSPRSSEDGALSFATSNQRPATDAGSIVSEAVNEREGPLQSNRSAAPTVATKAETLHSDAGHSKAATATTGGGTVSINGAGGAGSTFSSPNQSLRSLTTTLTTIQSNSAGNVLNQNGLSAHSATTPNSQPPVMFSHQYPVTPASPSGPSAIPRHISEVHANAAGNSLTDNASIITLASSSKRRRRSMDTDASVRALAPSSVWGGSRESLPLSVLSTSIENSNVHSSNPRPSIGGLASAERASVYSSQGITPIIASDRNSYYAGAQKKDPTSDAKSLRSVSNLDARSQYDAKSITDARSMDVASIRGYEGSVRSGAVGHGRQDSIPNSIGGPLGARHLQTGGLSRRNSDRIASDLPEDDRDQQVAE